MLYFIIHNYLQCGVFLVPALNIPMFLFAGFFVKLGEVASYLRPLCYISYFRYVTYATMI